MAKVNFEPNSHKYREEQKEKETKRTELKPVVKGKVRAKKKSGLRKAADSLVEEPASNVFSYLISDVIVPAAKKTLSDVVQNGLDMFLYGETGSRDRNRNNRSATYVSYRDYSEDRNRPTTRRNLHDDYNFDDIVFDYRSDVEEVLNQLGDIIDTYGKATVADLYDLVDMSCAYTANRYGWTNLSAASVESVRDGYILKMPIARLLRD